MAISTQGAKLLIKTTAATPVLVAEVLIKSFPDLGAAPAAIEVTSLADDAQKFIPGVKGMAAMEFVANYDETLFGTLITNENTELQYIMQFSDTLQYKLTGKHNALIVGGGLNVAVDMKVVVIPNSKIEKVTA